MSGKNQKLEYLILFKHPQTLSYSISSSLNKKKKNYHQWKNKKYANRKERFLEETKDDLKPSFVFRCLTSCKNFNKAIFSEKHTGISPWKMGIEGCGIELSKCIYLWNITVNTVAYNCINESVVSCYWNCCFWSPFC